MTKKETDKAYEDEMERRRPGTEIHLVYDKHLTDNPEIVSTVVEEIRKPGRKILIVAPTGSGKTYLVHTAVAEKVFGERNVVSLVPNTIQSQQNHKHTFKDRRGYEHRTISINGWNETGVVLLSDDDRLRLRSGESYSAVYDSVNRVLKDSQNIRNLALFIDEAHQLVTARNYRASAISAIRSGIDSVLARGGSICYMTATPDRILDEHYDTVIFCHPKSGTGTHDRRIEVILKDNKHIAICDAVKSLVLEEVDKGNIPMVRYNDKRMIRKIICSLQVKGIQCLALSAEDKGIYIDHETNITEYDSKAYQDLTERGILPFADVYFVTSVIEVGTSIIGLRTADGRIVQPESIVPVYACVNKDDFDLDAFIQFKGRPRFDFEKSVFLGSKPQKKDIDEEKPDLDKIRRNIFYTAVKRCWAFNQAISDRANFVDADGIKEKEFLRIDENGEYVPDFDEILVRSHDLFYRKLYHNPQYIVEIMEKKTGTKTSDKDRKMVKGESVPRKVYNPLNDRAKEILREAVHNGEFLDAVTCPVGVKNDNPFIEKLRKADPQSMTVVRDMRMILLAEKYDSSKAAEIAVRRYERGEKKYMDNDGQFINPEADLEYALYEQMADQKVYDIVRAWNTWKDRHGKKAVDAFVELSDRNLFEGNASIIFQILAESKKMELFIDCFDYVFGKKTWKGLCHFFATHSEQECVEYLLVIQYCFFNSIQYGTREWETNVVDRHTTVGTEYTLLRYPEKGLYLLNPKNKSAFMTTEDPQHPGEYIPLLMFPKGLINRTVTSAAAREIAEALQANIYRLTKKRKQYSPAKVFRMLKSMYRFQSAGTKDEDAIIIKGPRKHASSALPGADVTKEDAIRVCQEIAHAMFRPNITQADQRGIEGQIRGIMRHHMRIEEVNARIEVLACKVRKWKLELGSADAISDALGQFDKVINLHDIFCPKMALDEAA